MRIATTGNAKVSRIGDEIVIVSKGCTVKITPDARDLAVVLVWLAIFCALGVSFSFLVWSATC